MADQSLTGDDQAAAAILNLLRGKAPTHDILAAEASRHLQHYECGGYLYRIWGPADSLASLPPGWAQAIAGAHRKTLVDNLSALADFRVVGEILASKGIPSILLKGASYLFDLYEDPGHRSLTDVDILIRPVDVATVASTLRDSGYRTIIHDSEFRRFEVGAEGAGRCRFEFHWHLGIPARTGISQEEVWSRTTTTVLEGVPCRRLSFGDALLYHVAHQADHYFGPSLKWTIDLREMFRRWTLDANRLIDEASAWRIRTALGLALLHLEKLFPGEVPAEFEVATRLGWLRKELLGPFDSSNPLQILSVSDVGVSRYLLRCLLIDRPRDVLRNALQLFVRPLTARWSRAADL